MDYIAHSEDFGPKSIRASAFFVLLVLAGVIAAMLYVVLYLEPATA